jgi:hypothetical protein
MAKAAIRKPDGRDYRFEIGRAIDAARLSLGWNLDEFSQHVHRDQRQLARWMSGVERPQFDALFAVEALRAPLVIALAGLSSDIRVTTTISIERRSA